MTHSSPFSQNRFEYEGRHSYYLPETVFARLRTCPFHKRTPCVALHGVAVSALRIGFGFSSAGCRAVEMAWP
jgi:hypothetical protein